MTDANCGQPGDENRPRRSVCPTDRRDCPSDQEINDFLHGRVDTSDADRLADAIDQCQVCEDFVTTCESRIYNHWKGIQQDIKTAHPLAETVSRSAPSPPDSTSVSLLRQLQSEHREIAWERFVELYAPLIYHWTRQAGLTEHDAADCVQDILILLVEKLPSFCYDPNKSFRAWLRTVTYNKCRDSFRRAATIAYSAIPLEDQDASSPDDAQLFSDQEYRRALYRRALRLMQAEFEATTWQACWEQVVVGDEATQVAARLGISKNAAYLAKSRVLRRLREELDGLCD